MLRSTRLCCVSSLALASAAAATVSIEKLADPADLWPGHPTCPIGDTDSPAVDGGPAAYHPTTTACGSIQPLQDDGGTLSTVLPPILPGYVTTTTLVSGAFGGPSIEGSDIAIRALFGDLVTAVGAPRIDGGRVLFSGGDGAGLAGLYLWDAGALSKVVGTDDSFPGGTAYTTFWGHALDGARVYFTAEDGSPP